VLAVTVAVLVVVVSYARIYFGVDLTDEAYSLAMPYAFTLGAHPFVHEQALHQTAALLVAPIVGLYRWGVGSIEGLALFVRHLYFGLVLVAGSAVFLGLRHRLATPRALVVAAAVVAILPAAKPILSYNTLAAFFCTIAFFTGALAVEHPTGRRVLFAASALALGVAGFAYPPLIVAEAAFAIAVAVTARRDGGEVWQACRWFLAVTAASLLAVMVVVAALGPVNMAESVRYGVALGAGGGSAKLAEIPPTFARSLMGESVVPAPGHPLLLLAFVAAAAAVAPRLAPLALIALLVSFSAVLPRALTGSLTYHLVIQVALFVPLMFRSSLASWRRLIVLVYAPSLLAAITTAYTSTNGLPNAMIGFVPGFILALGIVAAPRPAASRIDAGLRLAGLGLTLALLVAAQVFVYRDDPLPALRTRLSWGPWRGIATSAERAAILESLRDDIARYATGRRSIVVIDLPGGYLLSGLRPAGPTVWTFFLGEGVRERYARYYADRTRLPDLVVDVRSFVVKSGIVWILPAERDPLRDVFRAAGYREVAIRERYRVLERPP
jgi:hypothetical protein